MLFGLIDRYLLREIARTWLAVAGVLLVILVSNQFARILGRAASGDLPRDAVLTLLGLTSLHYLTYLVPVALFLSVLLALGRLYADSEMAAISACGIGPRQLYRPLLIFALVLAALLAWLSLQVAPWSKSQAQVLKDRAREEAEIGAIGPGRFRSAGRGSAVFYAESQGLEGMLQDVFLERRIDNTVEVVLAARARQFTDPATGLRSMVLFDGRRYEGIPGRPGFHVVEFAEHGIPLGVARPTNRAPQREQMSTGNLLASTEPADIAELHWRYSAPVSVLVLAILALPLARTSPRQGRYGRLGVAVLIYIVYSNLLGVGQSWMEQGRTPVELGLWWVHGLVLLLAATLLWRQSGPLRRARAKAL